MSNYVLSEQMRNNLLIFLNRIEIKGITEIQAMTEILNALHNQDASKEQDIDMTAPGS